MRDIHSGLARHLRSPAVPRAAAVGRPPERPLHHPTLPDRHEPHGPRRPARRANLIPLRSCDVIVQHGPMIRPGGTRGARRGHQHRGRRAESATGVCRLRPLISSAPSYPRCPPAGAASAVRPSTAAAGGHPARPEGEPPRAGCRSPAAHPLRIVVRHRAVRGKVVRRVARLRELALVGRIASRTSLGECDRRRPRPVSGGASGRRVSHGSAVGSLRDGYRGNGSASAMNRPGVL